MSWLSSRFRRSSRESELDSELRFHLQELIDGYLAEGMPLSAARRRAALEFGGATQVKEECRDVHRVAGFENMLSNLKSAGRFIRKSPTFSATVIVTLALGIGANSAVFSAVDAILLRPLPFPDSNQLVVLHQYDRTSKAPENFVAPVRLEDWNKLNSTFRGISGYYTEDVSEISGNLPEKLTQALVAPRFLRVMGVAPAFGRDFTREEEHFGGPNAAIISDSLWRRRFASDPNTLGKALRFGSYSYLIVGIMPARFLFPSRGTDFWSPSPPDSPYSKDRSSTWFTAIGRLKPGISISQARADLARVQAQLASQFQSTDINLSASIQSLKLSVVGESSRSLWLLFGSVSVLLLIACTNIATMLLARTTERAREISIRYSLGASRASVIMQLLTEAFVLASIGSLAGLFVAWSGAKAFRSAAKALPRVEEVQLDWRIVFYALVCAVFATLACALVPTIQATKRSLASSLAGSSRTQVSSSHPLQWLLVGVQVALAVTLLIGSALLLRSFQALGRVSPGFDASHVLTFHISAGWGETANQNKLIRRINNDLDAIRSVPGVVAAATSMTLPGVAFQYPFELKIEGRDSTDKISSDAKIVSDGYFETMRIPILSGEGCSSKTAWATAVVNRSFADAFLNGEPLLGRHISPLQNPLGTQAAITGVAADASETGFNHSPGPIVYWCANNPNMAPYFLVRTHGDPATLGPAIRRELHKIEPARSVFDIHPLEEQLFEAASESRFRTILLSLFGLIAIALASIGLYGTLSYFVSIRHREVGLRMALGAVPAQILRRFLTQGLTVALLGCVAGLALAAALSRALVGMLYGVSRVDATSYFGTAAIVLVVAAFASVLPALRAARLDPMRVLREE